MMQKLSRLRRLAYQRLPQPVRGLVTLRANPILGLAFKLTQPFFRIEGLRFEVPRNGAPWAQLATYWFDTYEKNERILAARHVLPEDGILELGGCLGVVSCVANRLLHDRSRHVVVEANPWVLPCLYRNRALNGAGFSIEHAAAGDGRAVRLRFGRDYLTASARDGPQDDGISVVGKTLDDFCRSGGPFSVLLMDIEGGELPLLASQSTALECFRLIILELHPHVIGANGVATCRAALERAGFTLEDSLGNEDVEVDAWVRRPRSGSAGTPAGA